MKEQGLLMIVSGPSGCGKGTVLHELLRRRADTLLSVSCTTRSPRDGEVDGVDYFFKTRADFEKMIDQQAFLEYAEYSGNYYGTPKAWVEQQLQAGLNVLLEIEVQGAKRVMKSCPQAVSLFLSPPSEEILEKRLRGRGTEPEEVIQRRLTAARWELSQKGLYRYEVVNGDLMAAVDEMDAIIRHERAMRLTEA